jgi:hypothetical protein
MRIDPARVPNLIDVLHRWLGGAVTLSSSTG